MDVIGYMIFCKVFACWRLASQEQRLLQKCAAKSTHVDMIRWHSRACHDSWYCENRCVVFGILYQSFSTPSCLTAMCRKTAGICKNVQRSAFRHRSAKPCFLLTQRAPKFACASSRRGRRALKKFRLGLALISSWATRTFNCSPFKSRPGQLLQKNCDISNLENLGYSRPLIPFKSGKTGIFQSSTRPHLTRNRGPLSWNASTERWQTIAGMCLATGNH